MSQITLLYATGSQAIDRTLKGIIGFCELLFPKRIHGYYLQGSYASGEATAGSDIDLVFVFKGDFTDEDEKLRARRVDTYSEWLSGKQLDITPISEAELFSTKLEDATTILHFKYGSRLLFGTDIRDSISPTSHSDYIRASMYHALRAISWHHRHPQPLHFPLQYPDEAVEFYGFNQYVYSVDDPTAIGTERLIYAVVRGAGALLSLKSERLVFSKRSCVRAYQELITDEWAAYITEVFQTCHDQWGYQLPANETERQRLRGFYARALDFENYVLAAYHELLLTDVNSSDERYRTAAAERLALTFP